MPEREVSKGRSSGSTKPLRLQGNHEGCQRPSVRCRNHPGGCLPAQHEYRCAHVCRQTRMHHALPVCARGGQPRCPHHKGVDSPSLTRRGAGLAHRSPAWSLRPDAQSAQGRLLAKQPLKYLSNNPAFHHAYTAVFCNRSTRFASPFSDRPRLIPELEKTIVVRSRKPHAVPAHRPPKIEL